jgi:hypothetical protein
LSIVTYAHRYKRPARKHTKAAAIEALACCRQYVGTSWHELPEWWNVGQLPRLLRYP